MTFDRIKDRKRYLAIIAVRYLRENDGDTVMYDDAECDGWCLADDLISEWDLTDDELKRVC
jgi:hypothetical protein